MLSDPTKAPSQTGIARALYEIVVGASAQKCVQEMQQAMIEHATRSILARLALDLGAGAFWGSGGTIDERPFMLGEQPSEFFIPRKGH